MMALSIDTIIQTPYGPKKITDVKIGDEVFGADGEIILIEDIIFTGEQECYKLLYMNSMETESTMDNLWPLTKRCRMRDEKFTSFYVTQFKTLDEMLKKGFKEPSGNYLWKPLTIKPVQYRNKEVPLHPYLMGLLLGDGNLCSGSMSLSVNIDEFEIIKYIGENCLLPYSGFRFYTKPGCVQVYFKDEFRTNYNRYNKIIKNLCLNVGTADKFIPELYLYNSEDIRKELIRGLMDSDGTNPKFGGNIFSNTCNKLTDDLLSMVRSLGEGGAKNIKKERLFVPLKTSKVTNKITMTKPEIIISLLTSFNPYRTPTKSIHWKDPKNSFRKRAVIGYESIGIKNTFVLRTSGENNIFLINHFIPTT